VIVVALSNETYSVGYSRKTFQFLHIEILLHHIMAIYRDGAIWNRSEEWLQWPAWDINPPAVTVGDTERFTYLSQALPEF